MSDPYGLTGPPNPATLWGRVLADELARCGLRHAVIAPGSRSTPLALALAAHPDVEDLSVIDERSAAFVALGLARATGAPAAVVTTSGTAAANLLPAVVEADRAGVPLLLLTADRPPELRDAGDSQSADQVKLYGDRVRWFHQVAEPSLEPLHLGRRLRYLRSTACHALYLARGGAPGPPGPVHLDLPLSKPLEPTPAAFEDATENELREGAPLAPRAGGKGSGVQGGDPVAELPPDAAAALAGRAGGAPWRSWSSALPGPDPATAEELALDLAQILASARRPLLLAGAGAGAGADGGQAEGERRLRRVLARLLRVLPLPVWAEAASGLRLGWPPGERPEEVVATSELLLGSGRFRDRLSAEPPDLVLRLGEAPIGWAGRRLVAELAAAGAEQVAVDPWGRRRDPEHAVSRLVTADPAALLEAVAAVVGGAGLPVATDPGWLALHLEADRVARRALAASVEEREELFDGGVFHHLGVHPDGALPEDAALFVSSSMPLREVEVFLPAAEGGDGTGGPVDLFANRGVNGIDGVTSTALGVALGRRVAAGARPGASSGGSRTVLVTGDVAFVHDLSGALAAGRLTGGADGELERIEGLDLAVVVVDNGGGAIFDHLPAARGGSDLESGFTRHLVTPPGADLEALARGCGLGYEAPEGWGAFREALRRAVSGQADPAVRVIHVRTGRERAKRVRGEVMAEVAGVVDGVVDRVVGGADGGNGPSAEQSWERSSAYRGEGHRSRSEQGGPGDHTVEGGRGEGSTARADERGEGSTAPADERGEGSTTTGVGGARGDAASADPLLKRPISIGRPRAQRATLSGDTAPADEYDERPRDIGSRGCDQPLVLLHGFTGRGADWAGLVDLLDLAVPVWTPDLPGHGRSPVPEGGLTMEAAVAAVLDGLDRRGIGRVHLGGYSMGGRVALALAAAHPERLASLVLIGASPGIADEAARQERRAGDEELARSIEEEGLARFVDRWMAQPIFAPQAALGHGHLRRARRGRLRGSTRGYAASLRGMGQGAQPSYRDALPEIGVPVLLVAGERDDKYTRLAREMAEAMPDARVEIIEAAGHAVHLEAPEAVARAVQEHLERVGGSPRRS